MAPKSHFNLPDSGNCFQKEGERWPEVQRGRERLRSAEDLPIFELIYTRLREEIRGRGGSRAGASVLCFDLTSTGCVRSDGIPVVPV